jgi:hypothetical protein
MYSATVLLTIREFVPMTGVYGQSPSIDAVIAPPQNISPPPQPTTPVFSGDGQSITITVPRNYSGSVELIYQLPDPRYVLLGAAFKAPNGDVGRQEFRDITVDRDTVNSQMTVTDACDSQFFNVDFSYVILVQEVATGNIGLIDPDVETENGGN